MSASPRKGSAVLLAVGILVIAVGFGALVLDLGYSRMVDTQLQAAADAGAHAAVAHLVERSRDADGRTAADIAAGLEMGRGIAGENTVNGHAAAPGPADVESGIWSDGVFTPTADPLLINAVRVRIAEAGLMAPLYSLFSMATGQAGGVSTLSEAAEAIAVTPPPTAAGGVDCYLPIAIPSCAVTAQPGDALSTYTFVAASDRADTGGWGLLGTQASAAAVRTQATQCEAAGEIETGDPVFIQNGVAAATYGTIANAISTSDTRWDTAALGPLPPQAVGSMLSGAAYGRTREAPILVFDAPDCTNVRFNQSYPLTGLAWGVVFDVAANGSRRTIHFRIDNTRVHDVGTTRGDGGSVDWGVGFTDPPMLVR